MRDLQNSIWVVKRVHLKKDFEENINAFIQMNQRLNCVIHHKHNPFLTEDITLPVIKGNCLI